MNVTAIHNVAFTHPQLLLGLSLMPQGIKKGDVVTLYMPMIPELAMTMLACARFVVRLL